MHVLAQANTRRDGGRGARRPVGRPHRRRRRDSSRALVAFVVAAVNWGMKRKRQKQALTMRVFVMDRSNVNFVSLGDGLVASTKQLVFDEKLPVDAEAKELLCVGNKSRRKMKIQLVASKKEREKAKYRAQPVVVVSEKGDGGKQAADGFLFKSKRQPPHAEHDVNKGRRHACLHGAGGPQQESSRMRRTSTRLVSRCTSASRGRFFMVGWGFSWTSLALTRNDLLSSFISCRTEDNTAGHSNDQKRVMWSTAKISSDASSCGERSERPSKSQ